MKTVRTLAVLVLVLALLPATVSAAAKYVGVTWFSQPNPSAPDWAENKDGSVTATGIGTSKVTSIAYVPAGFDALSGPGTMPGDFAWEFDLTVPDADATEGGWAGFYFHASQPQTGAGGFLVHINSTGFALLDGENNVPLIDEPIAPELVRANDWNHVKVACAGKEVTIWLNGTVVFAKANTTGASGYLGFSAVNFKASYRNSVFQAGDLVETSFPVPGTEWKGTNETPSTPTPTSEPSPTSSPTPEASATAAATPTDAPSDPGDGTESGFPTWAILAIVALVVLGAGAAGFAFATRKK